MNAALTAIKLALSWMGSTTWSNIPTFGGLQLDVNPNDISLMGYSGGAETVNAILYSTNQVAQSLTHGDDKITNFISIAGVKGAHANNQGMGHLDSSWPNYLAIQADDDYLMNGAASAEKFVNRLRDQYNLNAFFLHYQKGGHQPFKPSMFYEIALFITDPSTYQQTPFPLFNDGEISAVWEELPKNSNGKYLACYGGGEVEPLLQMEADNWNAETGQKVCKYYCSSIEGCAGFDLLDWRAGNSDIGNRNCMLYGAKCSNPKRESSQKSEFLTHPYTGMASPTYCRKTKDYFGYTLNNQMQCAGASETIG